jgi:hypothetical protein
MSKMFLKSSLRLWAISLLLPVLASAAVLPAMPTVSVAAGASGETAIASLGTNLTAVAAHYGKSAEALRANFRSDSSLKIDSKGYLYFSCQGLSLPPNANANSSPPSLIYPLAQTFLLHSKPGSKRTIYLDFTGYTISGTQWNTDYNNGSDIVAPPWDIDGNPSSFNATERAHIQNAWFRVAEDYAAFDVDVTTEYPGEAALTRSSAGDDVYGTRALVSPISAIIAPAGGIAYVGVFNEVGNVHKPALIFPENLANDGRYIGEAISHEVGHNLNLLHQGTTTGQAYYAGQGNWAPIMGVGYYKPIVQWAKGEYLNANNTEDELANITSTGLDYRPADFGNNLANATQMKGVSSLANGIISGTGEADFFYFQSGSGSAWISVTNWEVSSDLHELVTVYDSTGNVVTNVETVDDASLGTKGVSFNLNVSNGKYYVSIAGVGTGNPVTTGYSSYASLGQYTLAITNPPGTATVISSPKPPYGTSFTNILGSNPNGPWYLFVQDDKPLDTGMISNGWFVTLISANPVGMAGDNAVYASPTNSTIALGGAYNLVLAVTNYGPSLSSNVVVSVQLPSPIGLSLVTTNLTIGSVTQIGSTLAWAIGNLQTNTGSVLTLSFVGNTPGIYSNTVSVASTTIDPNPDDDVITSFVTVSGSLNPPVVNSGFGMGSSGFYLTVTGDPVLTVIQASTNLVSWQNIFTNTPPFVFTNFQSTNFPIRFYRALLAP